jgi:predicted glycosyltransferase
VSTDSSSPRIALFTHDTLGLGHVRRCLHIIQALAERAPQAAILLITGSSALRAFEALPRNADYVKIPTIAKTGSGGPWPPHLPIGLAEISVLRSQLIQQTIRTFAPDVFLVDNFPLGSLRELLPSLQEARHLSTRMVLGLRDIVDAPEVIRTEWARQGIYEVLARYYDRILVYGIREVMDIVEAYALPPAVAAKVHYCGYVTAKGPPPRTPAEVRAELGLTEPFILVTGGGGGDSFPLLQTFLQALPLIPQTSAVLFTGPLMNAAERTELRSQAAGRPGVVIRDYVPDLPSYMAAASVVVAMCGYNSAAEILVLRPSTIVVPRTWEYGEHHNRARASSEWEQILRAQALEKLGLVDLLDPKELTPARLAERVQAALARPKPETTAAVNLQGLECVARHVLDLAYKQ